MQGKKILFLLDDIWSLGPNKGVVALFELLKRCEKENKVVIFTTDKYIKKNELPNSEIYYFDKLTTFTSTIRYIQIILNRLNIIWLNMRYIYKFSFLACKDFDLVYCSSSLPIYASIFIRTIFKIKTVHRMYGTFLYPKLNKWVEYLKNLEEFVFFNSKAEKYIITNDGTHGDKVATHFKVPKEKVVFLRNGVTRYMQNTQDEDLKAKYNLDSNKFYLLSVSRLVNWKRVDRIIQAMNKILNTNIELLIVGDGAERKNLESISLNCNIRFLGAKVHSEVRELMTVTDLFISMYDLSNVGNPLLEALVEGCAIITLDVGDTSSVINDENGILIKQTSEEDIINELQRHIEDLFLNKDKTLNLRRTALTYAKNNLFDWNHRIKQEMGVLEGVINYEK